MPVNPFDNRDTESTESRGALRWLWLSLVIVVLDHVTKWMILTRFELYERVEVLPVLGITRMHNTGAAFSFLADASGWQRWFFIILAIVVTVLVSFWLKRLPKRGHRWLAFGLAHLSRWLARLTGKPPLLTPDKVTEMVQDCWVCDATKARRVLGFRPQVRLADGIRSTVNWYKREGWL